MTVFDEFHDRLDSALEAREVLSAILGSFGFVDSVRVRRGQFGHQHLRFFSGRLDRSCGRLNFLRGPHNFLLNDPNELRVVLCVRVPARDLLQDVPDGCLSVRILQSNKKKKSRVKSSRV